MNNSKMLRRFCVIVAGFIAVALVCYCGTTNVVEAQQTFTWNQCNQFYDFDIKENTKFFPRSNLDDSQLMYFPTIDAINQISRFIEL